MLVSEADVILSFYCSDRNRESMLERGDSTGDRNHSPVSSGATQAFGPVRLGARIVGIRTQVLLDESRGGGHCDGKRQTSEKRIRDNLEASPNRQCEDPLGLPKKNGKLLLN